MKFIQYNEELRVTFIHNMPFDEVNGLGKSEEELLKIGALVEDIPQIDDVPRDKVVIYKYNKEANKVITELADKPLTPQEQQLKDIELVNASQDELIDISLLATDEMYMMIEPLLSSLDTNTFMKGGSKMVDMYVAMVIRGLKTIDEVPARYREQVREILDKLEK